MKFSVNTLTFLNQKYGSAGHPAPDGVDALVKRIGSQLGEVEGVSQFGKKFDGVLVARVASVADHPNADRLHVCWIDDGGVAQNVERNDDGFVQVVCGAPNVREGLLVAWLPPGSTVPSSAHEAEPFALEARELRGVVSNGMLASPKELALSDNHDGILEIALDSDESVAPGTSFVDAFHLHDDVLIDIENKMFTHRPDCFGWLGVARELEGIQGRAYKSPDWYTPAPAFPALETSELPLEVHNEIPQLVPRFSAVVLSDITVKQSPTWLQIDLARAGLRPINNIVDYTNFYMLLTGQPLHAYDYDKVKALDGGDRATIVVRNPRDEERLTLLNGKTINPRQQAILIASGTQPIGLGGVMGGADTEVDEHTKNIILESANFDMYSIRRSSMQHGIFSDAVTRFNKGQSPLQTVAVLARITEAIRAQAGGKVASQLIDSNHLPEATLNRASVHPAITVTAQFINDRLGVDLAAETMAQLLRNVEFSVTTDGDSLTVAAPFWRTDIELREDIVEEVGRLHGFDNLPLSLPPRSSEPTAKNELLELKREVRTVLARAGANEALTYSFVHGKLLERAGQDPAKAFKLSNALSPELQYYRLSLTPSLLEKVHPNIKAGFDWFALFEIGKGHNVDHLNDDHGLPSEFEMLDVVVAGRKPLAGGAPFYQAKKLLTDLAASFGLVLEFQPFAEAPSYPVMQPYDHTRAALVKVQGSDIVLGAVGEFKASVRRNFKLPDYVAGFGIGLEELLQASKATSAHYTPLARFPKIEQDICLRVSNDTSYGQLEALVLSALGDHVPATSSWSLTPLDIYQRENDTDHKQTTFRLTITDRERTLTDTEVAQLLDSVALSAQQTLHAERV